MVTHTKAALTTARTSCTLRLERLKAKTHLGSASPQEAGKCAKENVITFFTAVSDAFSIEIIVDLVRALHVLDRPDMILLVLRHRIRLSLRDQEGEGVGLGRQAFETMCTGSSRRC